MGRSTYIVALGSNRAGRWGSPRATVAAALDRLGGLASPVVESAPLGPSIRTFANAVTLIVSDETPPALLARLKAMERAAGRRAGRRWGARTLDCDIVLWSGGCWQSRGLTIPHPAFRTRDFVLAPLATVAACWRDPVTRLTVAQLRARLTRRRPARRRAIRGEGP